MRTATGKKLAAVWKHPDLRTTKVSAYTRNNIPEILTEYWGCSSDLYAAFSKQINADNWSRIAGLWSETEGVIE